MRSVFALTTRGLETIGAREMSALDGISVDSIGYRRVVAHCQGALDPLLTLCTVDDLFLDVATWFEIERPRVTLARLRELSAHLDLHAAVAACREVRPVSPMPSFAITANFVGKRNYNTQEIKEAVAEGVAARHGWRYVDDDAEAELNLRLFIEHATAYVGLRLGATSLHRRFYKQAQIPGSLKPTVAAAMLLLAEVAPGQHLLDPCCGAGTILIEAGRQGVTATGGDLHMEAVAAARMNAASADVGICIEKWDARRLPLPEASVECIVSNLPWGRQVRVSSDGGPGASSGSALEMSNEAEEELAAFYTDVCAEMERVLAPSGRIVLLTNRPQLLHFDRLQATGEIEISLFGQTPVLRTFTL
jgi:tRNA (guanine6-N2)-methyltransferase